MFDYYKNNSDEGAEISIRTPDFATDQVFTSREELMDWVQNTGRSSGVVIVTKRSNKHPSGFVYKVVLMCDRGGKYKVQDSSKVSGTKKSNCLFELEGKYSKEYNYWTLTVICDEHNHHLIQYMEGHPYAKRLAEDEISLVADLTRKNVMPRDILSILKDRNPNNVCTLKTIYNTQQKIRLAERVGRSPMQTLMSILHSNGYVYEFTTNDSNELENLFFVHPISFDIWRAFPHVVIIDATYKTNIYNLPFVEIVGVTSTSLTFSIAFAFMEKEREANYTWVLNCLNLTLDACMQPRVIITDRELALMNACHQVFPDATRLLCRWHISQNIMNNCRQTIRSQHDWDSFLSLWKLLEDSPTQISYMNNYDQLKSMLIKYPRVLKYIDNNWLNKYKEMFISAWIDQHLNFGNRITNRVESQHAKLKKYLKSSKSSLDKFVKCIDEVVKAQHTSIKESLEKSRIVRIHQHNLHCFLPLRGFVSNVALNLIFKELQRLKGSQIDSSNCGYQLRNSCGLPCACELAIILNLGQCIPLDSIDIFWRKLDISPSTSTRNDYISCDDEVEAFKENFNKESTVVKKSLLRKLRDIIGRSTTFIREPRVQKNTRGRPSLKKQQPKRRVDPISRDPHRNSYSTTPNVYGLDSIKEPARHSSYVMDLNKEPMGESSHGFDLNNVPTWDDPYDACYSHPLMAKIPDIFHPYVTHIQNVTGDGNCGFRSIAVCLGYGEDRWLDIRHQLLDKLRNGYYYYQVFNAGFDELYQSLCFSESPAPSKHWMIMPMTAILIANRFGVIVHCLSIQGSMTCFPLWRGPEEFQHHQTLTVAHINENHYVMVQLQGEYPMPHITRFWTFYRSPNAALWETIYTLRLQLYTQLKPCNSQKDFVDLEN